MNLWLLALYYVVFDYLGYGAVQDEHHNAPLSYRAAQVVFCWVPITLVLGFGDREWQHSNFSLLQPFAFFLLWWTFFLDWGYYALTFQPFMDRLGTFMRKHFGWPKTGWDDAEDTRSDFANGITHAYWTPYGFIYALFNGWEKATPVAGLVMQSIVGFALVIIIQLIP